MNLGGRQVDGHVARLARAAAVVGDENIANGAIPPPGVHAPKGAPGKLLHGKMDKGAWAFMKPSVGKEGAAKPRHKPSASNNFKTLH